MKDLQSPDAGEILHREGANIASVVARLAAESPATQQRIKEYLKNIVPGITDVTRVSLGPKETLEFRQQVDKSKDAWRFHAANMSDGTLRALGILVAVGQLSEQRAPVRLVGVEEPETALHPASTSALMDALREASGHTQVVVTTHSPDLLDALDPDEDRLLVVQSDAGKTSIASVDAASLNTIRDHLLSAGDLLRLDQLEPDRTQLEKQEQLEFGPEPGP
jgi:predicted ATPase